MAKKPSAAAPTTEREVLDTAINEMLGDPNDHGNDVKIGTGNVEDATDTPAPAADASEAAPTDLGRKLTPVGKLTVATIFGKIPMSKLPPLTIGTEPNPEKEMVIGRIAGFVTGIKSGVSQYGPWEAFVGEFAGTNLETGEIFMSKTALIPGAMGEALLTSANQILKDGKSLSMKFAVKISVTRSPREPDTKYVYVVRPEFDAGLGSPALALLGL